MKRAWMVLVLACLLLLCGCGKTDSPEKIYEEETVETTEESAPEATVPPEGNPGDVTCKGSYTGSVSASSVVATAGEAKLTAGELQVWYWAQVAQYREAGAENAPDFDRPLDTQVCQIDSSVASWQQYFLKQALSAWHTAQALVHHSQTVPLPTVESYQPGPGNYEEYMTGMPATKVMYGYNPYYTPNSMHQAYLDALPDMLSDLAQEQGWEDTSTLAWEAFGTGEAELNAVARLFNQGYMYFTQLTYGIEAGEETVDAYYEENKSAYTEQGICVDMRHILLLPEGSHEADWLACEQEAADLLSQWQKKTKATEATFAEMANKQSQDAGSALNGGAYRQIRQGQLVQELDAWCFDPARQVGDTTILRTGEGVHILYFSGSRELARVQAEADFLAAQEAALMEEAKEACPLEVNYGTITLGLGTGTVSAGDLLYPDIAHERYPEVPLYLQQDYGNTMFGGWLLRTNGCGITTLAMIATYFTDTELTPPEMCARYGRYSHKNGTDGMIFNNESPVMGFYLREKTYDPNVAKAALTEGQIVVSIQHKGYWTRGGHYIILEDINEDGMVQVRDSNLYNYRRVPAHVEDRHTWGSITGAGSGYWIFEDKITYIPACTRCGTPEVAEGNPLAGEYTCEKCMPALMRRHVYLSGRG